MREQVFTPLRIVYKNQLKSIVRLAIFTRFKQTNYFQIFSVGSFAEKKNVLSTSKGDPITN